MAVFDMFRRAIEELGMVRFAGILALALFSVCLRHPSCFLQNACSQVLLVLLITRHLQSLFQPALPFPRSQNMGYQPLALCPEDAERSTGPCCSRDTRELR